MLDEVKKKEQELKQQIIDAYKSEIRKITDDLKAIDEKYLKKIEKEKKSLKESLKECNEILKAYGVEEIPVDTVITHIEEAVDATRDIQKAAEEEEKVVDTLFDENNIEEIPAEAEEAESQESSQTEPEEGISDAKEQGWDGEDKKEDDDEWPDVPEEWN